MKFYSGAEEWVDFLLEGAPRDIKKERSETVSKKKLV